MTTATKDAVKDSPKETIKTPEMDHWAIPVPGTGTGGADDQKIKFNVPKVGGYQVPEPQHKGQKRISVDDVFRHPEQPRYHDGSEQPTAELINQFFGRHKGADLTDATTEDDKSPHHNFIAGQDARFELPVLAHHKDGYTILRGHRRAEFVKFIWKVSPELGKLMFPGKTLLWEVREINPVSSEGLLAMDDHGLQDERRPLLLIEDYDRVKSYQRALCEDLKAKPEARDVRAALCKRFGKERVDKILRLDYLPPAVTERMRTAAKTTGTDTPSATEINILYQKAQDHATEKAYQSALENRRKELKAEKASEKRIAEELAKVSKPERREKPRPDPKDPGADFIEAFTKVGEAGAFKVARSLSKAQLEEFVPYLGGLGRKKDETMALVGLINHIANGNADAAKGSLNNLLDKMNA